jgi:hypothetical protein
MNGKLIKKPRQCWRGKLCIGHEIGGSVVLPDTSVRWRDYPYAQTVIPARGVQGLVLTCKHDRQNPRGLFGIGRIFRSELTERVVVVDLPEELLAGDFEAAEVVLAVRVIVCVKVHQALDLDYNLMSGLPLRGTRGYVPAYVGLGKRWLSENRGNAMWRRVGAGLEPASATRPW